MSWLSRKYAKLGTRDWFQEEYESIVNCNSPKCSLLHAGGNLVHKLINHVGSEATTDNLFIVSGPIRIIGFYGVVTAIGAGGVGTDDTMADLKIELFPGPIDITLANGDITDNGTVGTLILKDGEDSVKMTVLEADAPKYYEAAEKKGFQEGFIVPQTGTTTYIRASYTGDAATDITIFWVLRYAPKTTAASVTAV